MGSESDAKSEILHDINKKLAEKTFNKIIELTETESKQKAVEASKNIYSSSGLPSWLE